MSNYGINSFNIRHNIMRAVLSSLFLWLLIIAIYFDFVYLQDIHHSIELQSFSNEINKSLNFPVDASFNDMQNVYHTGNLCPFKRRVMSKLKKMERIKILIIGGSVTYGADLPDRLKQRWSKKFIDVMNSGWYKGYFDIQNLGVGACNIDVWIYRVNEMKDADLIIVDLSPNDQGFDLQALPHLYNTFIQLVDSLPNHPALFFHEAFRTGAYDLKEYNHCKNKADQGTCCNGFIYCRRWYEMQDFVAIALSKYSIPYISYRDLAWPNYYNPPSNLNQWWNGASHPDVHAHQMIGKLLAFGIMVQIKEAHLEEHCEDIQHSAHRYISHKDLDESIQPICHSPLTSLKAGEDINSVQNFQPYSLSNSSLSMWKYYNDSKLKFGWILSTNSREINRYCGEKVDMICTGIIKESEIVFKIKLSEQPRLQLYFLKSYMGYMDKIQVWIDNYKNESVMVDGNWAIEYSVAHVLTITQSKLNLSAIVLGESKTMPSLSSGEHLLHLAIPEYTRKNHKFKWKLLGITTC